MRKSREFSRVFQRPVRAGDDCLVVLARSNELSCARLGMAVSIKHAGNAVQRNRVRRVIRESFRQHQHELPAVDVVVTGRPGLALRSNAELRRSLEQHWHRLGRRWQKS